MSSTFLLARRYLWHYPVRTGLLVACIALVAFLPIAVELLIRHYQDFLSERARRTPLVVGAKGSRFDLLLGALYFKGKLNDALSMAEVEEIEASELAAAIPLHVRHTARGFPIVGTRLEYFDFRGLRAAAGTLPLRLGDAVLGANVAQELELAPDDRLLSDNRKLYDLSSTYPLRMRVAGVLARSGTADDDAVFVDIRTSWVIEGIGHGHQKLDPEKDDDLILEQDGNRVAVNAAIVEYTEITPDNVHSFHFHGGAESLPTTAIVVVPPDEKSGTILKARLQKSALPLVPDQALAELMDIVFRVKRFFDTNLAVVLLATSLFLVLVILLSLRVRQREFETLFRIGCRRSTVLRIQGAELTIVIGSGLAVAALLALLLQTVVIRGGWVL